MLEMLLSYDPNSLSEEHRAQMAKILSARGDILRASAEVNDLRARAWAGEEGLADLADLKAADLAKLREDYRDELLPFLKEAVDLEQLQGLIPMVALAAIRSFRIPPPVVMEALGLDVDNMKMLTEQIKKLISEI